MKFYTLHEKTCSVHVALAEDGAQEWAMLGAMFSRSNEGVEALIDRVKKDGASGKFMETYYSGYGHQSIGELCDVKIYIEGVPFFVAALIEHHARFRGQESSTRYIDFSKKAPVYNCDPQIHKDKISFYSEAVERVKEGIASSNEYDETSPVQIRAIAARAFDICRSLLPLSCTTNVAWYGDIRTMRAHLNWMRKNHEWSKPYVETIRRALDDVYTESMGGPEEESYNPWLFPYDRGEVGLVCKLDFGSWRDLNRHRVGYQNFMLPGVNFHPWYIDSLGAHNIDVPEIDEVDGWDNLYLGNVGTVKYLMPRTQLSYLLKLRSRPTVHPTLRIAMQELCKKEILHFEDTLFRESDPGPFGYFLTRGKDTIGIRQPINKE